MQFGIRCSTFGIGAKGADRSPALAAALWIAVLIGSTVPALQGQTGSGYDLTWSTIDSGGQMFSTGDGYELGGTIGQADAGELTGENGYALTGGFWAAGIPCECQLYGDVVPGFCLVDVDDIVCVLDAFVLAGAVTAPCSEAVADIEPCGGGDGDVDSDDILAELSAFIGFFFCPHPCPP